MLPTAVKRSPDLVQVAIDLLPFSIIVGGTIYMCRVNDELADKLIARNKELSESNQKCIKLCEFTEKQEVLIDSQKVLIDKQNVLIDKKHDYIIRLETVNELQAMLIESQADTIYRFDKRIDTPLELK